ncbi:MAG: hypothetical protein LBE27_08740 [Deltaproteobacteria bacterium]|jgi:hypothetical protein|nr:hypothetical protein [Deltaproteobacteria bacterium]
MKTALSALSAIVLALTFISCAPKVQEPKAFDPESATSWTISALNELVTAGNKRLFPTSSIKVQGFVISRYQGGPVGKEILGLSETKGSLASPRLYCLRAIPAGGASVTLGDEVELGGYLARASGVDNIFINDCTLLSKKTPPREHTR